MKRRTAQNIIWLRQFFLFTVINEKFRHVALTPPWFKSQILYDGRFRKFSKLKIRDMTDWETVNQVYLQEDYALRRLTRYEEIIRNYKDIVEAGKRPLIIDCGANIGVSSKYFSENFPESTVIAIEPNSGNHSLATTNCVSSNVIHTKAAISSRPGLGAIKDANASNNGFQVESSESGDFPMITVSDILKQHGSEKVSPWLIKIDIEGFESNLFSENTDWIDDFPIIAIELHDWLYPGKSTSMNFISQISKKQRDFVLSGENVFSIKHNLQY
jgi:FkbM family methyltransferase